MAAVGATYALTSSSHGPSVVTQVQTTTVTSTSFTNSTPFPVSPPNLVDLAKAEGSITIYSIEDPTSFSLHTWPAFQQMFPWAKVNFVPLDPGSLISRPIAEYKSGHVTADLDWWGPNICGPLQQAGVLAQDNLTALETQEGYTSSQIAAWQNYQIPTVYIANVLFYNTNLVNASQLPTSYAQLADPQWKGKIALANPTINDSPGATYTGMFYDMGQNNATWTQTMRGIAANQVAEPFGGQAYTDVSQGTYAMGIDTQNDVLNGIAAGLPVAIDWKIPTVYLLVDSECILKGAPDPNMALLFAEWEMSASSGPAEIGAGFLPAQPTALQSALATVIPGNVTATIVHQYYDNNTLWSRVFTNIFGSGG